MTNTETLRRWAVAFALMGMGVCLVLIIMAGEAKAGAIDPDMGGDFTPAPALVSFIAFCLVFGVVLGWLAGMRDLYVAWLQRRRLKL